MEDSALTNMKISSFIGVAPNVLGVVIFDVVMGPKKVRFAVLSSTTSLHTMSSLANIGYTQASMSPIRFT